MYYAKRTNSRVRYEVVYENDEVLVYREIGHYLTQRQGGEFRRHTDGYGAYRMVAPHNFYRSFIPVEDI